MRENEEIKSSGFNEIKMINISIAKQFEPIDSTHYGFDYIFHYERRLFILEFYLSKYIL